MKQSAKVVVGAAAMVGLFFTIRAGYLPGSFFSGIVLLGLLLELLLSLLSQYSYQHLMQERFRQLKRRRLLSPSQQLSRPSAPLAGRIARRP